MSLGLPCPNCTHPTDVKDSRPAPTGIRRRRKCSACDNRFTTIEVQVERVEEALGELSALPPAVIRQARELALLLPKMESEDRLVVMGMARRLTGLPSSSWRLGLVEVRASETIEPMFAGSVAAE